MKYSTASANFPNGLRDLTPYPTAREQVDALKSLQNVFGSEILKKYSRADFNSLLAEEIDFDRKGRQS